MSERQKFDPRRLRIISDEPVLARLLRKRRPLLIGREGYEWILAWMEDVGIVLRSRENIVLNAAFVANYAILAGIVSLLEALGIRLPRLLRRAVVR